MEISKFFSDYTAAMMPVDIMTAESDDEAYKVTRQLSKWMRLCDVSRPARCYLLQMYLKEYRYQRSISD